MHIFRIDLHDIITWNTNQITSYIVTNTVEFYTVWQHIYTILREATLTNKRLFSSK